MTIRDVVENEARRREEFPVVTRGAFFGHAGVCPLPRAAVEAMTAFLERGSHAAQEGPEAEREVATARERAARLIGAESGEITLLGPTSLGLSLVANGLDWREGDEVVYYQDDYPANVYPWKALERFGVTSARLEPAHPGAITWETVEAALTPKTRLVSLATASFLSGFRIDAENIGRQLHERGVLFCLDAIQTLGAFPLSVEHVDFLSADSHKWLLGPAGAGIVYIAKEHFGRVRPTLLGSWNVYSPDFAAQDAIRYYAGGRRYEPGMLNLPGIAGMSAGMGMLMDLGIEAVGQRILRLRRELLEGLRSQGWRLYIEARDQRADASDAERSGIVTVTHPERELSTEYERLKLEGVTASLRKNRHGQPFIRFSPHFYNTVNEIDRTLCVLGD